MKTLTTAAALLLLAAPLPAQWTSSRPDGHAPIGVMGDHRHEAGEVMLSYRFMYMDMDGSRNGTDRIADATVIDPAQFNFMVTPTRMPMMMHMAGIMYAPHDRVTLMAMLPFIDLAMDHITRMGGTRDNPAFTTTASGVGDLSVSALIGLAGFGKQALHAHVGVSVPTGSIERTGVLPTSMGNAVQLPYPMQLGSGTVDLQPGITYLGQSVGWSWGVQARGTVRLGDNDRGYTLGDRFLGTIWAARRLGRHWSLSLRAEGIGAGDIEGADPAPSVNPALVPTARTDLRSGGRIDLAPGINFHLPRAKGLRFAAELLVPAYQHLDGPQLETDWTLLLGVQVVAVQR